MKKKTHIAEKEALNVAEIFASIQGETSWAGLPCAFVRLAGCNLKCSYCDTEYARKGGTEKSIDSIMAEVSKTGEGLVCITGGEPLLQQGARKLAARLVKKGYKVLVETNGSQPVDGLPARAIKVVDVKTPGSGEGGSFLKTNLGKLRPADELKFVITGLKDFNWAVGFIRRHRLEKRCGLLISPAWSAIDPAMLAKWIIDSGKPLRLNIQLHKIIWGPDATGV